VSSTGCLRLDHDDTGVACPRPGPSPPTRNSSSIGLLQGIGVGLTAVRDDGAGASDDLVEQLLDPVGQHGDLLLLHRYRDDAHGVGACR